MAPGTKSALAVAFLAAAYQFWAKHFIFSLLGIGREVESIENFPFNCRRVVNKQLEGCEDLWLDEAGRVLYAACSGSIARSQWNPGMSKFNLSGRRTEGSELMAIYIDHPIEEGFRMHKITPISYKGTAGDTRLDLVGFDAEKKGNSRLRFWLINQRPPVDTKGNYLDATKIGVNGTVDVFEYTKGATEMKHVKTVFDQNIYSGNKLALIGNDDFVLTNDHSGKVGFRKELDMMLGGGNVAFCPSTGPCHQASKTNTMRFPNGLVRGNDSLIYVPFVFENFIGVYRLDSQTRKLVEVDRIVVGMPTDNLSVDSNGDIWTGSMPKLLEIVAAVEDPLHNLATSTIWKISQDKNGKYTVTKMLEDKEMKVISAVTTAVHDVKTGRLFLGGVTTPWLTVCEKK
ncbi:hypothetical protein BS50DRAFT_575481 [Corynespora cassiicola Philippines]|uniref:Calcium-dependent phosphotriesterase n=1 Tax=Corynespora cassiicola Philippines TaxID=1448308 RepID=A0A2T2NJB5_CORCC|nr:hypothetical protein BS50DRAFT_575481 [Corynespora cassiicola Philippines]